MDGDRGMGTCAIVCERLTDDDADDDEGPIPKYLLEKIADANISPRVPILSQIVSYVTLCTLYKSYLEVIYTKIGRVIRNFPLKTER